MRPFQAYIIDDWDEQVYWLSNITDVFAGLTLAGIVPRSNTPLFSCLLFQLLSVEMAQCHGNTRGGNSDTLEKQPESSSKYAWSWFVGCFKV